MTQDAVLLLAVAVIALYMVRLAVRLAPLWSEFPLKTLIAGVLAAAVALADLFPYDVGRALRLAVLVGGPLYAFGPMAAVGLARIRRYRIALLLISLLYWTGEGRDALRKLLAQVALQRGDLDTALGLIPSDEPLMLAQAYALSEQWERVMRLDLDLAGDNSFVADAVRVEALLGLGRVVEAERLMNRMQARWEHGPKGPLAYRSLRISEARMAAERGEMARVRELLTNSPPGIPAHRLLELYGRAAQQAARDEDAGKLYSQAYSVAPEGVRGRYARRIRELGREPPQTVLQRRRAVATLTMASALALAYVGQLLLDANVGPFRVAATGFDASTIASAFLLGVPPTLPEWDAWWRYLSYAFVHGNLLHIGFNVWVLIDIGRVYEARRGPENVLASFVFGTVLGAVLSEIAHPGGGLVLVGASGGVLGVAGALLADAMVGTAAGDRALKGSLLRWMALIALISVAIPGVSLWGHVGGVVGGLLWGFLRQGLPRRRSLDAFAGAAALALLVVALAHVLTLAIRLASI